MDARLETREGVDGAAGLDPSIRPAATRRARTHFRSPTRRKRPVNPQHILVVDDDDLPKTDTLRNNTQTNCPVTPIDKRRRVGVIGPLALLRLSRWIEQRSQVSGGAEPCHPNSSNNKLPQHPPAPGEPGDTNRSLGSLATSPAESVDRLPQRDGAEQPGQQPAEGRP